MRIAEQSNLIEINNFLTTHFDNIEPTHASHVRKGEKLGPMPPDGLKDAIESKTSLMAFREEELVGVLIAEKIRSHSGDFVFPDERHSKGRDIMDLLSYIEKKADICSRFKLTNCLNIFLLSVHKDHVRRGIAGNLFEFCIANGKARGFEAISVDCTSYFTSRLAEKFEMSCVSTVTFDDYNKHIGKILFIPNEPHNKIQTYLKVY